MEQHGTDFTEGLAGLVRPLGRSALGVRMIKVDETQRPPLIIQPAEVQALFRKVLRGNDHVPDAVVCMQSARLITSVALRFKSPDSISPSQRLNALALHRMIEDLKRALRKQNARWNSVASTSIKSEELDRAFKILCTDRINRIQVVEHALQELQPVYEEQIWPKRTWKEAAFELFYIFKSALQSIHPGRKVGHSSGGPAVRFVQDLLPHVAGVTKTEGAISTELKRTISASTKSGSYSVPEQALEKNSSWRH